MLDAEQPFLVADRRCASTSASVRSRASGGAVAGCLAFGATLASLDGPSYDAGFVDVADDGGEVAVTDPNLVAARVSACLATNAIEVDSTTWKRSASRSVGSRSISPCLESFGNGATKSNTPATASVTTPSASASSAPLDPGAGLGEHEVKAILDYKKKHPSMGPAQIRAQLKRFLGWRVSVKAIARVLRRAGFPAVHRKGRPVGQERPGRFEAPHRNALWQLDFTELRIGPERRWLLVIFSRSTFAAINDSASACCSAENRRPRVGTFWRAFLRERGRGDCWELLR